MLVAAPGSAFVRAWTHRRCALTITHAQSIHAHPRPHRLFPYQLDSRLLWDAMTSMDALEKVGAEAYGQGAGQARPVMRPPSCPPYPPTLCPSQTHACSAASLSASGRVAASAVL